MLELRPCCEHCEKSLPPDSLEAMICTFECTFCATCVTDILHDVCPNCGGNFVPRPIRPKDALARHSGSTVPVIKSVDWKSFELLLSKYKAIPPVLR